MGEKHFLMSVNGLINKHLCSLLVGSASRDESSSRNFNSAPRLSLSLSLPQWRLGKADESHYQNAHYLNALSRAFGAIDCC